MNLLEVIDQTATSVQVDEEPEPADDFGALEPRDLDAVLAQLSIYKTAITLLQHQARGRFADYLGTRGFARFGDRVYRAGPERKTRLRDETASEFWELVQRTGLARRLFNPNQARTTGLRDLAGEYVDRHTGEIGWDAFEDHFLEVTEGEVKVSELPVDRAPKFIQKLDDGTVESRG